MVFHWEKDPSWERFLSNDIGSKYKNDDFKTLYQYNVLEITSSDNGLFIRKKRAQIIYSCESNGKYITHIHGVE